MGLQKTFTVSAEDHTLKSGEKELIGFHLSMSSQNNLREFCLEQVKLFNLSTIYGTTGLGCVRRWKVWESGSGNRRIEVPTWVFVGPVECSLWSTSLGYNAKCWQLLVRGWNTQQRSHRDVPEMAIPFLKPAIGHEQIPGHSYRILHAHGGVQQALQAIWLGATADTAHHWTCTYSFLFP